MGERLRLGIVGCGDVANAVGTVGRRLVPRLRLTACCDSNAERAAGFARRHRIQRVCASFDELLAAPDVDAVYLAVPHDLHAGMVIAALEAGKPVLVEKPLARTPAEGARVVQRAKELRAKVGVNYQYRYDAGCYALAQAVRASALGVISSVRINVPWHRECSYFENAPWHASLSRAGGGTLITQGSHFLDVALWALRDSPVSAMGYAAARGFDVEVETIAHGIVQTAGDALIQIASSMIASSEQDVTIEFYGDRGTGGWTNRPFPKARFRGVRVRAQRPPGGGLHAFQRSLAGFVRWVQDDEPFLTPARETLAVLSAVDAIYRSARSGVREPVADTGEVDEWQ